MELSKSAEILGTFTVTSAFGFWVCARSFWDLGFTARACSTTRAHRRQETGSFGALRAAGLRFGSCEEGELSTAAAEDDVPSSEGDGAAAAADAVETNGEMSSASATAGA